MNQTPAGEARPRGRPRDNKKDEAIREAAWALIAECGLGGLTFEAIAERVGCSRTTLYRRFTSQTALLESVLYETSRAYEPILPAEADPRAVLIAHATATAHYLAGPRGRAVVSLMDSAARNEELDAALLRYMAGERTFFYQAFRRVRNDAPEDRLSFVFDTLSGNMVHHVAVRRRNLGPDQIAELVDSAIAMLHKVPCAP